jgi:hypothetical protein
MEHVSSVVVRVLARLQIPRPVCRCGETAELRERRTSAGDVSYFYCARCQRTVSDA